MKLLPEYVLLHESFNGSSSDEGWIAYLRRAFFSEGLVRDLHNGAWARAFRDYSKTLAHPTRGLLRELLEALHKEHRLVRFAPCSAAAPKDAVGWCREALASHRKSALAAIIASSSVAEECSENPVVSLVKLRKKESEIEPAQSLEVRQETDEYLRQLDDVLRHAGRICFMDPYLNENASDYREFPKLIMATQGRTPRPRIELHRMGCLGENGCIDVAASRDKKRWQTLFQLWNEQFTHAGLRIEVCIWNKFHNRYLLSDLIALQVGKGFFTSKNPHAYDDWSRLSRARRESLDREFDENSVKLERYCTFSIGAE